MTIAPSGITADPSPVPTTAGTPCSRAMIAAWQVRPPRSVTTAAAVFITGSQSGVVVSETSTSPGRNSLELLDAVDDASPAATRRARPPPAPVRSTSPCDCTT